MKKVVIDPHILVPARNHKRAIFKIDSVWFQQETKAETKETKREKKDNKMMGQNVCIELMV